jgi:hypothetical protein
MAVTLRLENCNAVNSIAETPMQPPFLEHSKFGIKVVPAIRYNFPSLLLQRVRDRVIGRLHGSLSMSG